jgi:hypothetical protein
MTILETPLVQLLTLLIFVARIAPSQASQPSTQRGIRESRLALSIPVAAQIENESHYFAKLARTDFEAGYNYQPAPVGTAQIGCAARSWSAIMERHSRQRSENYSFFIQHSRRVKNHVLSSSLFHPRLKSPKGKT